MNTTIPAPTPRPAYKPIRAAEKMIRYRAAIGVIGGSTFFTGSQVAPVIDPASGQLVVTDGLGEQRHWGTPYCHAHLTWLTPKIVQIDLRWGTKHSWDITNYYYSYDSQTRSWTRLTRRHLVIKALLTAISVPPGILTMPPTPQAFKTDLDLV